VAAQTNFRSSDYPVIAWSASGIPDNAQVRLLWHSDTAPERTNMVPITVAYDRLLPVSLSRDSSWAGNITGLALAIQGPLEQPVLVEGVSANPMGLREVLRSRLVDWLGFEPWSGASINTISGGSDAQDLPLPVFLFGSALIAIAIWAGVACRRGWFAAFPAALGASFLAIWLVSDARWSWNLLQQVRATVAQYGGKDARARHLAADDGPLFAFIENVRAKLPAKPARVFVAADANYFRNRAAYHLYPNNVFFLPEVNALPDPGLMQAGDYIVVYERRGIQFDSAAGLLRWDGLSPVRAELILLQRGGALFRLL